MPYATDYRPAEVFMEYKNVTIYHVYKDNDPDQGVREFWFDTQEDSQDEGGFDVRDLASELRIPYGTKTLEAVDKNELTKSIIRASIDSGLITASQED
jgi:hypothetical protein